MQRAESQTSLDGDNDNSSKQVIPVSTTAVQAMPNGSEEKEESSDNISDIPTNPKKEAMLQQLQSTDGKQHLQRTTSAFAVLTTNGDKDLVRNGSVNGDDAVSAQNGSAEPEHFDDSHCQEAASAANTNGDETAVSAQQPQDWQQEDIPSAQQPKETTQQTGVSPAEKKWLDEINFDKVDMDIWYDVPKPSDYNLHQSNIEKCEDRVRTHINFDNPGYTHVFPQNGEGYFSGKEIYDDAYVVIPLKDTKYITRVSRTNEAYRIINADFHRGNRVAFTNDQLQKADILPELTVHGESLESLRDTSANVQKMILDLSVQQKQLDDTKADIQREVNQKLDQQQQRIHNDYDKILNARQDEHHRTVSELKDKVYHLERQVDTMNQEILRYQNANISHHQSFDDESQEVSSINQRRGSSRNEGQIMFTAEQVEAAANVAIAQTRQQMMQTPNYIGVSPMGQMFIPPQQGFIPMQPFPQPQYMPMASPFQPPMQQMQPPPGYTEQQYFQPLPSTDIPSQSQPLQQQLPQQQQVVPSTDTTTPQQVLPTTSTPVLPPQQALPTPTTTTPSQTATAISQTRTTQVLQQVQQQTTTQVVSTSVPATTLSISTTTQAATTAIAVSATSTTTTAATATVTSTTTSPTTSVKPTTQQQKREPKLRDIPEVSFDEDYTTEGQRKIWRDRKAKAAQPKPFGVKVEPKEKKPSNRNPLPPLLAEHLKKDIINLHMAQRFEQQIRTTGVMPTNLELKVIIDLCMKYLMHTFYPSMRDYVTVEQWEEIARDIPENVKQFVQQWIHRFQDRRGRAMIEQIKQQTSSPQQRQQAMPSSSTQPPSGYAYGRRDPQQQRDTASGYSDQPSRRQPTRRDIPYGRSQYHQQTTSPERFSQNIGYGPPFHRTGGTGRVWEQPSRRYDRNVSDPDEYLAMPETSRQRFYREQADREEEEAAMDRDFDEIERRAKAEQQQQRTRDIPTNGQQQPPLPQRRQRSAAPESAQRRAAKQQLQLSQGKQIKDWSDESESEGEQ